MTLSRREILRTSATVPALALLAACGKPAVTFSSVANDVTLVAAGLGPVVNALQMTPGVTAATVAMARGYLATIEADAKQIATATENPPTAVGQEVVQDIQALAGITSTIPALAPYAVIVEAAVAMIPVILAGLGVQATGASPKMSAAQARATLAASAAK